MTPHQLQPISADSGHNAHQADSRHEEADRGGKPRHQSGPGSPLGRLRRKRLRGGAPDLPRGCFARVPAIGRAHPRPAQHSGVSFAQPSRKRFTVRQILGAADLWVTEFVLTYDGQPSYTVSIMEFRDRKVVRETQYFGDPFEPGASRAQWVERIR